MKLLIASRNPDKIAEIADVLKMPALELTWLTAGDGLPEVEEDGDTFQVNAIKKAVTIALAARLWTLADDSGLEVDALGGVPGVRSARYAGRQGDYAANNARLLRELAGIENRSARFRCVIALASPSGRAQIVEGVCEGRILEQERGSGGFGYDPLFVPNGYDRTFAEMDSAVKNSISHRARALCRAREAWGAVLSGSRPDWPARQAMGRGRPLDLD